MKLRLRSILVGDFGSVIECMHTFGARGLRLTTMKVTLSMNMTRHMRSVNYIVVVATWMQGLFRVCCSVCFAEASIGWALNPRLRVISQLASRMLDHEDGVLVDFDQLVMRTCLLMVDFCLQHNLNCLLMSTKVIFFAEIVTSSMS